VTDDLLETLLGIASEAADLVLEVYSGNFSVHYKAPRDPITEADQLANDLICTRLAQAYPDIPIVAEESNEASFAHFRESERVFFVDPVDGTREFVAKNGEFVVMIGLLDGERATHGVLHAPATRTAWAGAVDRGAFRVDASGARSTITASDCARIQDARVLASRSPEKAVLERAVRKLGAREVILVGSLGLKAAAIAEGTADAYVSPVRTGKRWDACACDALVSAAGGVLSDRHGAPIEYRGPSLDNDRGLVMAPAKLHPELLGLLATYQSRREASAPKQPL
jgi:3'(2'), 5'-bisphosphate nucleotidase